MGESIEESTSMPVTPRPGTRVSFTPPVSTPPSQFHSPSFARSPLLESAPPSAPMTPKTPRTPRSFTPRFITPIASPIRRAIKMTKLDPQDAWLPITESRNGNAYYAAFHTLCSGIGIQGLVLPFALTILGWTWGIIFLSLAFIWQLYTLWIMVQLHESADGTRYSRYLQLFSATFGPRLTSLFATFPVMYLSGGTCTTLIIIAGSASKLFFQVVCGNPCTAKPLTTVEWYLVFTCAAVVVSQLPNMNSIAGISLLGAVSAVGYCTLLWVVSLTEGRIQGVSYNPVLSHKDITKVFSILNALGIIAFAFRGHNLVLEIQATMPSSEKHPSRIPMWRGVKFAYVLVAMCLYPLAIAGYWAYGQMIPENGGMLSALFAFHSQDASRFILGLTSLLVVVNSLCSFQIYGMPMFDHMENKYTSRFHKACPWWLRVAVRCFTCFIFFLIAVALPFLESMAGLVGGLTLPLTLAYPCFLWLAVKKPKKYSVMWYLNWGLGVLGGILSGLITAGGIYTIVDNGVKWSFFNPK
ncbi:hypothetical protein GIB67_007026 [Kingdonia uniflora]|uniref:Amino acid transporter transmembrane domain-containing protein n=1 Tax=Kingdonia uniflora TaxID=39325 RepID=A0A7J7NZJ2_9MAGN|nr:hypothetical protein GIB67_007026 [Kingdonia uniflora]